MSVAFIAYGSLQTVSLNVSFGPATVVIASTISLVDSTGKNDSVTEVNPGWTDTQTGKSNRRTRPIYDV